MGHAKAGYDPGPSALVIDGAVVPGAGGTYPVVNPARPSEVVFDVPAASLDQVDQAVRSARRASVEWSGLSLSARADALGAAAGAGVAAVAEHDLARLLTREHGKVLWEAAFDAGTMDAMAAGFASMAREALAPEHLASGTTVEWVPHGVVAAVLPFNWPVSVMANKVLPALLAGNTIVVKAPPTCPGAVLAVAAAMARALPPGVLNVICGPDAALGAALVHHLGVDMVSFTGGVPTGRAVMAAASASITPVVLELGGNDAAIIAEDMTIDDALAGRLFDAAFVTSGQVCMAIKRLYVHRDRLGALVEALVERVSREVLGDGLAEGVTMGPVHLASSMRRADALVAEAEMGGAKVHRPARLRRQDEGSGGYFVSPALVVAPDATTRLVQEEQFAPVLPIVAYDDLDAAVSAANATPFGLCASIWSDDAALAADVAGRLEAGTVFINAHGLSSVDMTAPMGGWKQSGLGVELGPAGLQAFARRRVIVNGAR